MKRGYTPTPAYRLFLVRLRLARQEQGLSQRELARRLNVHHSIVNRAEAGLGPALDVIRVREWLKALEVSLVEFTRELDAALLVAEIEGEQIEGEEPIESPEADIHKGEES